MIIILVVSSISEIEWKRERLGAVGERKNIGEQTRVVNREFMGIYDLRITDEFICYIKVQPSTER